MNDQDKTRDQLVAELAEMRRRVAELEASEDERSRAEETLLRAKREWERTFDSVPDLIAILDNHYRILRVNQPMADRLGLTPGQCIGLTCYETIHGLSQPPTFCPHALTLADGQDHATEVHEDRLGGDFLVTTTPLFDERRQVLGSVHVARDITERKQAEEAENKFRSLVEITSDFIWEVDQDIVFTYASPKVKDLLGYEPKEVIGKKPFDLMPSDESDRLAEWVQDRLERKNSFAALEAKHLHKDGRRVVLETSGVPIRDGDGHLVGFRGIGRDVTDRKRAEEDLRHSHDELQGIYRGMCDGLLVADIETNRFLRTNPALCRMLGYSEDELLSLSVKDIHPPEDVPTVLEKFKAQAEGRLIVAENIPLLRKDKSVFYADITTTAIDYLGRRCNIGVIHDTTERKQAEEALRREYRVLRQMLMAQDRERQLVAYEIHDGLAQQLTGAGMQFEAFGQLQNGNPQQASDCFSAGLHLLKESVAEARRLIAGLRPPVLDEAGVLVAIGHLINDVTAQNGPEVQFHSSVKFNRLEPFIENAIFRIVQESLTNVRRHSKSDTAEVKIVQAGDHVRVEVQDWGVGFDSGSIKEGCFGLAGIRERARVLGGRATFDSAPGQGTRIVVELPVAMSEPESQ